jgi:hypothetical protein
LRLGAANNKIRFTILVYVADGNRRWVLAGGGKSSGSKVASTRKIAVSLRLPQRSLIILTIRDAPEGMVF